MPFSVPLVEQQAERGRIRTIHRAIPSADRQQGAVPRREPARPRRETVNADSPGTDMMASRAVEDATW
jgi:hypothetical protein